MNACVNIWWLSFATTSHLFWTLLLARTVARSKHGTVTKYSLTHKNSLIRFSWRENVFPNAPLCPFDAPPHLGPLTFFVARSLAWSPSSHFKDLPVHFAYDVSSDRHPDSYLPASLSLSEGSLAPFFLLMMAPGQISDKDGFSHAALPFCFYPRHSGSPALCHHAVPLSGQLWPLIALYIYVWYTPM